MRKNTLCASLWVGALGGIALSQSARASFHDMQIEQVIGGVNGNTAAQAIQLRMCSGFQNQVQQGRLVVADAAGNNPIVLIVFPNPVFNQGTGVRILIATTGFAANTTPAANPDFIMTNPIPASYLAAGTLTFEQNPPFPTIYWRLSWGGATYTGTGVGNTFNDPDGNFNPPFPSQLPSMGAQAVQFLGPATADSTNNAADYALTTGPAVFFNNTGESFTVNAAPPTGACCFHNGSCNPNQMQAACQQSGGTWQAGAACPSPNCLATCPADIAPPNGNGAVNVDDLLAVINHWGLCPIPCRPSCQGDVTGNCSVNVDDLLAVINSWGPCPP